MDWTSMSTSRQEWTARLTPFASGAVLALFLTRVAQEAYLPLSPLTLMILALASLIAWRVVRRLGEGSSTPLLALALYLVYPFADQRVAFGVSVTAALMLWLGGRSDGRKWKVWTVGTIVRFGALALFVATVRMGVLPADSGELQLVGSSFGLAHPPGFPLYTIVANLWTAALGWLDGAYALNLLSAVISAATAGALWWFARRLTESSIAATVAAIGYMGSFTIWSQAATTNVRSTTALLFVLTLVAVWKLVESGSSHSRKKFFAATVLLAASAVAHHASLAFALLPFGLLVMWHLAKRREVVSVGMLYGIPALLLGLLPLSYTWFKLGSGNGQFASIDVFLDYVLARGFESDFFYYSAMPELQTRLQIVGDIVVSQFGVVPLLFAGLGMVALAARWRGYGIASAASFVGFSIVAAMYRAPQTVEYLIPAYLIVIVWIGVGAGSVLEQARVGAKSWHRFAVALLVSVTVTVSAVKMAQNYQAFRALQQEESTSKVLEEMFRVAEGGEILANWHWATALRYGKDELGLGSAVEVTYVAPSGSSYGENWRSLVEQSEAERLLLTNWFDELGGSGRLRIGGGADFIVLSEPGTSKVFTGAAFEGSRYRVGEAVPVQVGIAAPGVGGSISAHLLDSSGISRGFEDIRIEPNKAEQDELVVLYLAPIARPGSPPGGYELVVSYREGEGEAVEIAVSEVKMGKAERLPATSKRLQWAHGIAGQAYGIDMDTTLDGECRAYVHRATEHGVESDVVDLLVGEAVEGLTRAGPFGIGVSVAERYRRCTENGGSYVPFGDGTVLVGVKSDAGVSAGSVVDITATYSARSSLVRDVVFSSRMVGFDEDEFTWLWSGLSDAPPSMGAVPTLKWIPGVVYQDRTLIRTPEEVLGLTAVLIRHYDAFTGRTVQILDERIADEAPFARLDIE